MTTLRFAAAEAWYEFRAGCRGPLIPIAFPGLITYVILVLLNTDYLRDFGATDVPRNKPAPRLPDGQRAGGLAPLRLGLALRAGRGA